MIENSNKKQILNQISSLCACKWDKVLCWVLKIDLTVTVCLPTSNNSVLEAILIAGKKFASLTIFIIWELYQLEFWETLQTELLETLMWLLVWECGRCKNWVLVLKSPCVLTKETFYIKSFSFRKEHKTNFQANLQKRHWHN